MRVRTRLKRSKRNEFESRTILQIDNFQLCTSRVAVAVSVTDSGRGEHVQERLFRV